MLFTGHVEPRELTSALEQLRNLMEETKTTTPQKWPKVTRKMGFPSGSVVKNLPANAETQVPSLGQEDPLGKEMATHSSLLAWRIPGQRSLGGCSPWNHKRVGHNLATKQNATTTTKKKKKREKDGGG